MNDIYSPYTGEHIVIDTPSSWMMRAGIPAPDYDRAVSGCFWQDGAWVIIDAVAVDMSEVAPGSITMRQARLALLQAGLLNAVSDAVSSMSPAAQIEWEYAVVLLRDNALVLEVAGEMGWSADQLDALFLSAAAL